MTDVHQFIDHLFLLEKGGVCLCVIYKRIHHLGNIFVTPYSLMNALWECEKSELSIFSAKLNIFKVIRFNYILEKSFAPATMNKIAPENVENLEEDVEQPTTIMKGVLLTSSFLLIAGITVFCITLHVWIGVLVTTGINRVDISELTGNIYHPRVRIGNKFNRVCVSVCLSLQAMYITSVYRYTWHLD